MRRRFVLLTVAGVLAFLCWRMEEVHKQLAASEEKELWRVYTTLCNYARKSKIYERLNPKREQRERLVAMKKVPDSAVGVLSTLNSSVNEEELNKKLEAVKSEIRELEEKLREIEGEQKKVTWKDLNECFKKLGRPVTRVEIEDIIWEVDENLDGLVDWQEFKLTYQRNLIDSTGLEPHKLFDLIQFMLYDKDGSGKVTVDETLTMLYKRHGKDKLEGQMKLLFGEDLKTEDGDGELSFTEYLNAVGVRARNKNFKDNGIVTGVPKGKRSPTASSSRASKK